MKLQALFVAALLIILTSCGTTTSPNSNAALNSGNANGTAATASDLSGNWQFTATSSVVNATTGLVGYVTQSGNTLEGTVHVYGTNCYDYFTNVSVSGTVNGQQAHFTTAPVNGQVLTMNSTITGTTAGGVNGTYTLAGGCGNGDTGTLTGFRVPSLSGQWTGSLAGSSPINLHASLTQGGPDQAFGAATLSGTVSASNSSCFSTGTVSIGHAAGTSVSAIVATDGGTLYLSGYSDSAGKSITGNYNIDSGTCAGQSGSFTLGTN